MTRSEIVGANIYQLRTSLGLSQIEFADLIGRSQTMVSMYEKGLRLPSTKILAQIGKVLGCTFDSLYFSEEERNGNKSDEPYPDDPFNVEGFTNEEYRLIDAYRNAQPEIRRAALQLLELNPATKKANLA